jgi:hemerythrin-like metal-binding protein
MSDFVKWSDKYKTGNVVVDYQHQRMFHLLNTLEEVSQGQELVPDFLNVIFEEVTQYTVYHFKTEEELMEKVNYSGIEEHKLLHKSFIDKLELLKLEAQKGTPYINLALCVFLKEWWIGHIAAEDQKIVSEMSLGQGLV